MCAHGLRGGIEIYFNSSTQSGERAMQQGEIEIAKITARRLLVVGHKKCKWYSGFRTGNMKGAWWMPWRIHAMKDVTSLRNASGR